MRFDKLCLVITDRCSAACDFCGFSCSPEGHQVMDAGFMARMIREAKDMGMKLVSFSGGEPFLYPELLKEGARLSREAGMKVSIATNGFWGAWEDDKIRQVLEDIKPDSVGLSTDFFHRKFVPEDAFARAVFACSSMTIRTTVYVSDLRGEYSAGKFIKSMTRGRYGVEFGLYPAYRVGRALDLPKEMFILEDRRENIGCLYDHNLSVIYNGDVYPCCRYQVYGSALKMGNATEQPLDRVVSESGVTEICDVIMESDRFNRLMDEAAAMGIDATGPAGCSCDYCRRLFGTKENREKLRPCVDKIHGEMLVRSLMKEAEAHVQ